MTRTMLMILAGIGAGTAALAQETPVAPTDNPAASAAPNTPADATTPDPAAPPAQAVPPAPPAPDAAMTQSAPQSGATTQNPAPTGSTDTSNYPRCSRAVTDKCVNRGGR
ncbi:hypothetical protein [Sphingomonas sp.]|uniref:hypothetical protein n=1 Tax=Sphingomonas sp. TaxID=28214 RepID=UPI003B3B02E8